MKLHLLALCSLTLLAPMFAAAESFPQLEPHRAKCAQDRQILDEARVRQIEALRSRYLAALTAARVEAAKANKGGAVAAIDGEISEAKSEVHAPAAPADLPRTLAGARREFTTGCATLEKSAGLRIKELNTRYLQTLITLEKGAETQKNSALAAAVAAEKAKILAPDTTPVAPSLHKNAIPNGEFSNVDAGGLPIGWKPKGADYQGNDVPWQNDAQVIQEGSEKFLRFRRAASVRLANLAPATPIPIPERAKAAVVSVRMRVKGLVPGKNYDRYPGVSIKAADAAGQSPGQASAAATENTRWRLFTAKLTLQPGAKTLDLSLGPCASAGICDFDDVTVKFE